MTHKTEAERTEFMATLPEPPEGCRLTDLDYRPEPGMHPYVISSSHVVYAADHCSGNLTEEAIAAAERHGAKCGYRGCTAPYSAHKQILVLFVEIPQNSPRDLNEIKGLGAYLAEIKERCEAFGITGFAFPSAKVA